jgi:hypothetical protein
MTFDERVAALASLGFSEKQTRFLVMVALHSGFCLRRHYTAFAGLRYGAGVRDFLDRLVSRRLARRLDFRRDRGHVYHLCHSSIYNAIDQDDNRNRRRTSAALIARKVMLLDYVLAHRDVDWYATEADKVALFTGPFAVPALDLQQRIYVSRLRQTPPTFRYFIHKLPIGLAGDPPVLSFVFLVTDSTGQAFEQFLKDHLALLNHIPRWRIVAVAPRHIPGLPACEVALRRVVAYVQRPHRHTLAELDALTFYFTTLDCLDRNDICHLSIASLNKFRETRPRFAAAEYEVLFQRWKVDGPTALTSPIATGFLAALAERRGVLETYQLPIRYDRFGSYAGVV